MKYVCLCVCGCGVYVCMFVCACSSQPLTRPMNCCECRCRPSNDTEIVRIWFHIITLLWTLEIPSLLVCTSEVLIVVVRIAS